MVDDVVEHFRCKMRLTPDGEGMIVECAGTEAVVRPSAFRLKGNQEGRRYLFNSPETEKERELMESVFHTPPTISMKEKMKKWFEGWTI